MSPVHREGDGSIRVAGTWGGLVERLIEEAMERGEFDDLPLHGRPLALPDDACAGEMRLAYNVLRNAGVAPPWIEADKEVRALLARRDALLERVRVSSNLSDVASDRYRRELTDLVMAHDHAVDALNAIAPTPLQHRRHLELAQELRALERALEERP
jgi:hypothetical protein